MRRRTADPLLRSEAFARTIADAKKELKLIFVDVTNEFTR